MVKKNCKKETESKKYPYLGCLVIVILFIVVFIIAIILGGNPEDEKIEISEAENSIQEFENTLVIEDQILKKWNLKYLGMNKYNTVDYNLDNNTQKSGAPLVYKNYLIDENISRDNLVELAKELHSKEPKMYFAFFDNDDMYQEFIEEENKIEEEKYSFEDFQKDLASPPTLPASNVALDSWVGKHQVALLNEMSDLDNYDYINGKYVFKKKWTLTLSPGFSSRFEYEEIILE